MYLTHCVVVILHVTSCKFNVRFLWVIVVVRFILVSASYLQCNYIIYFIGFLFIPCLHSVVLLWLSLWYWVFITVMPLFISSCHCRQFTFCFVVIMFNFSAFCSHFKPRQPKVIVSQLLPMIQSTYVCLLCRFYCKSFDYVVG